MFCFVMFSIKLCVKSRQSILVGMTIVSNEINLNRASCSDMISHHSLSIYEYDRVVFWSIKSFGQISLCVCVWVLWNLKYICIH